MDEALKRMFKVMFQLKSIRDENAFEVEAEPEHIKVGRNGDGMIVPMLAPHIRQWSADNDVPLKLTLNDQDQIVVAANSEHHITLFTLAF